MTIAIIEGNNLDKQMKGLERKLQAKTIRQSLRKAGKVLATEIGGNVPVDEGELKDSVKVRSGKRTQGEASIQVGVSADDGHAAFVEYGTENIEAQPFVRPAFDKLSPELADKILREIEAGIAKALLT